MAVAPVASIIVSTRNRAASLERCLRSINDEGSATPAELIVVDNGSTDATCEVIRTALAHSRLEMTALHEPIPGSSRARNAGVRVARGELVLFTDDDAVIHEGWIDALCGRFEPDVAVVGGRVLPRITGATPVWLGDLRGIPMTIWDQGAEAFEMNGRELPFGVNMALRRASLERLEEPFDLRLGHRPGVSMGYEETRLVLTAKSDGRVVYEPSAVVEHVVDGDRLSYRNVRRSFFQSGFGRSRHLRLAGERAPKSRPERFRRAVNAYGRAALLRIRNGRRKPTAKTARQEFDAFLDAGMLLETLFAGAPRAADWCARRLAF